MNKKYANGEIRPKKQVKSEYFQFPLVLAAAISIHKAQGQTYANGINIDPEGAFDYNQIYVGISRSTALDLIHFDHELKLEHIKTDPNVTAFVEGCRFRIAERCAREESERAEKERLSKIEEEKKKKADEEKRKEDLGFFYDFPNLW